MLSTLLSSAGGLSNLTDRDKMFNKKINEAIEILYDSIYLLAEEIKEIREEVDYLLEVLDND